jgi:multicomponent Na+:H+ antiporter subunit E
MFAFISKFLLILGFFLILTSFNWQFLAILTIITAVNYWLFKKKSVHFKEKVKIFPIKLIFYGIWLLKEIIISSYHTIKVILGINKLSPNVVEVKLQNQSSCSKVIYANSITLTPGTLTIFVDKKIMVHSLNNEFKSDLIKSDMFKKIEKVICD